MRSSDSSDDGFDMEIDYLPFPRLFRLFLAFYDPDRLRRLIELSFPKERGGGQDNPLAVCVAWIEGPGR